MLELAGAPTDLVATTDAFHGVPTADPSDEKGVLDPVDVPTTAGEPTGEGMAAPHEGGRTTSTNPVTKTSLYASGQLQVFGVPVEIRGSGTTPPPRRSSNGRAEEGASPGGAYGGYTDLSELDSLGMDVVLSFERERLRREGLHGASVFEGGSEQADALIFDVSTLAAHRRCSRGFIALRRRPSTRFSSHEPGPRGPLTEHPGSSSRGLLM